MISITLAQVKAINEFREAGKSPWITVANEEVTGVYANRDGARSAKKGTPTKHVEGMPFAMESASDSLPTGEAVADGMGHPENVTPAEAAAGDKFNQIDDSNLEKVEGVEDSDAAEFAADKAAAPMPEATVKPIPPVSQAPALEADKAVKVKPDVRHASEVIRPTKLVWHIADKMLADRKAAGLPEPTRKEVMAECDRQGIAFYTARTQYQVWKQMQG